MLDDTPLPQMRNRHQPVTGDGPCVVKEKVSMFDICTRDLSQLFWRRLLRLSAWHVGEAVASCRAHGERCEISRPKMEYQTGSIPFATAVWLYLLADFIKAKTAVEVGTFIGKSTLAIAAGMQEGTLWTCDASNSHVVTTSLKVSVRCHPKTKSTDMLAAIPDDYVDFYFFDGRVMDEDVPHIQRASGPTTIFAFDDFEGTEKGVINVAKLRHPEMLLIEPPTVSLPHVHDRSTMALLVPAKLFRMTAQ